MSSRIPTIFSDSRRMAARRRMLARGGTATFVLDDMVDDTIERVSFIRARPERALVIGDYRLALGNWLAGNGAQVSRADIVGFFDHFALDLVQPFSEQQFDLVACLGLLDTVNDLPGALIHLREALVPGGLAIASFVGAGSLPVLRHAMLAADGDRPAARMHPLVDVRAAAQLLQRAGWADPVVDSHELSVRYGSFERLVEDVREHGLGGVLASPAPPLTRVGVERARAAFDANRDADGRVTETYAILTLTGRKPKPRF